MSLRIVVPVTIEPITLEEAMEHLNIAFDDRHNDAVINRNIKAAREWCEGWLGRALAPQTLELSLGGFNGVTVVPSSWQPWLSTLLKLDDNLIRLPMGPVSSIVSVTYRDGDGIAQTLAPDTYTLDTWTDSVNVYLAFDASWPTVQAIRNAVQVQYVAGYTLPDDSPSPYPLPWSIRAAMLLALGDLFANRENSSAAKMENIPLGAQSLMEQYKLRLGMA
jgi:uncharacterized phiE125 gp8 family phage protein